MMLALQYMQKMCGPTKRRVVMSRIDQKTCVKTILGCNLELELIDLIQDPLTDSLTTNLECLEEKLKSSDDVLCVSVTTSCFAPRIPDDLRSVARLCRKYGSCLLINNAYGVADQYCRCMVNAALNVEASRSVEDRRQRPWFVVQSTDKNFLVPVGGCILSSSHGESVANVARLYPGRASASPAIDLLITFLSMGKKAYQQLLQQREQAFETLHTCLSALAQDYPNKIRVLHTPHNCTSIAVECLDVSPDHGGCELHAHRGSMLYHRR